MTSTMSHVGSVIWSAVRRDRYPNHWHSLLNNPATPALLYQADENAFEVQETLRGLTYSKTTFVGAIAFFIGRIGTAETEEFMLTYIRSTLEVFVLYSLETSNLDWLSNGRASRLSRQTEHLSSVAFSRSCVPPAISLPVSITHCSRMVAHLHIDWRLARCRAQIVEGLVDLARGLASHIRLTLYDPELPHHVRNVESLVKRLNPSGHYWVAMAYCLAVEVVDGTEEGYQIRLQAAPRRGSQ